MLARFICSMNCFATAKYQILKGKYLIPPPPKRSLSSYILFSNDIRASINATTPDGKKSVTEASRQIAEKWKNITPEEKKKYEEKAKELRDKYEIQSKKYQQLYVQPFKKTNYNSLLMKEYYSKNKVSSITQGQQALKKLRQSLKEQDIAKYKKQAEDKNLANQKIAKNYLIPTKKYKNFNSYLRALHTDKKIPVKSELTDKQLEKLEKQFQQTEEAYKNQLKSFAKSFHITVPDLIKLINKQKGEAEKIDQQGNQLKQVAAKAKKQAAEQLKAAREKLNAQKKKIKQKAQKNTSRQLNKLTKQYEKKKKASVKVATKFSGKIGELKRKKAEALTAEKVEKQIKKSKAAQAKEAKVGATTETSTDSNAVPATEKKTRAKRSTKTTTKSASTSETPVTPKAETTETGTTTGTQTETASK